MIVKRLNADELKSNEPQLKSTYHVVYFFSRDNEQIFCAAKKPKKAYPKQINQWIVWFYNLPGKPFGYNRQDIYAKSFKTLREISEYLLLELL